jgi:acetyl esterase/lipase
MAFRNYHSTMQVTIPLWSGPIPYAHPSDPADIATLSLYMPRKKRGSMLLVFPGGGYGVLAAHEGDEFAWHFSSMGITTAVCRYRHGREGLHPAPLADAKRAIRLLRHRAAEFGVQPDKIACIGSSAGGHLAATLSTRFDAGDPQHADPIERLSSRPDAVGLCYPVITLLPPFGHEGSANNLLGKSADQATRDDMSAHRHVTAQTPPTFLWHTLGDTSVPIENSMMYASALRQVGVPFELHCYEKGNHGQGLAIGVNRVEGWGRLFADWLISRGW